MHIFIKDHQEPISILFEYMYFISPDSAMKFKASYFYDNKCIYQTSILIHIMTLDILHDYLDLNYAFYAILISVSLTNEFHHFMLSARHNIFPEVVFYYGI
jgi:hypothetical protein